MVGQDISDLMADPDRRALSNYGNIRLSLSNQFGDFNRFYADGQRMTDPRARSAFISASLLGIDFAFFDRLTVSLQLPFVVKQQKLGNPPPSPAGMFPKNTEGGDWTEAQIESFRNNVRPQLAEREAQGIGDIAINFSSNVLPNSLRAAGFAFIVSTGLRIPTGNIEEDGGSVMMLPQPFQLGSGHPELLLGASLQKAFENYSLFLLTQGRVPLTRNKLDYVFGKELSITTGGMYALPFLDKRIRIGGQLDFSQIEKDNVQIITNFNINDPKGGNRIVPYPLVESNGDILNTGGTFLYIGPTLEIAPVPGFLLSANFSILVIRNANGNATRTNPMGKPAPLGQALAEGLFQISAAYTFGKS